MMILSLLFLCMVVASIYYYFQKKHTATGNRYRKTKRVASHMQTNDAPEDDSTDSDEVVMDEDEYELPASERKSLAMGSPKKTTSANDHCVIVLHLMAPEGCVYAGYELLQSLLSAGLRFGKQQIFNRHIHKDGRGDILFHCASVMQPGTFDLTKMGTFSTKGLSFFFSAADVEDPLSTFDCMLETIDQLVEDLGGQVLNAQRELFTKEKMVRHRQQLRAFETGQSVMDLV